MKTNKEGRPNQLIIFNALTRRHLMVFLKNIPIVIFTLMVPLAVLAVYALFLRPMEVNQIKGVIDSYNLNLPDATLNKVYGIADCWMMAGVLSVSCITVSLNTNYIMVNDKERDVNKDMISSPISPRTIMLSYFAFNVIVTFVVITVVYLICIFWLLAYGAYMITAKDFFAILGVLLLSIISAALLNFFIASFINSNSVLSTVVAIFSAAVGFLIGAYLPDSMMPLSIKRFTAFFPGTYSTALLRSYFLDSPIEQLTKEIPEVSKDIQTMFSNEIGFFDLKFEPASLALVILVFICIFLVLNLIFSSKNTFKGILTGVKKIKKQEKKELLVKDIKNANEGGKKDEID